MSVFRRQFEFSLCTSQETLLAADLRQNQEFGYISKTIDTSFELPNSCKETSESVFDFKLPLSGVHNSENFYSRALSEGSHNSESDLKGQMADLPFDRLQEFPEREKFSLTTGHSDTQTSKHPFICEICKKQLCSRGSLKRHSMIHLKVRPYVCQQCGKSFLRSDNLTKHLEIHSKPTNFNCEICKKQFRLKRGLGRHMLVHSVEKPTMNQFLCPHCGKRFIRKQRYHLHLQGHTDGKHFTCEICSYQFQSETHLAEHMIVHSTGKVPVCDCGQCGKPLETSWSSFYPQDAHGKENRTTEFPDKMPLSQNVNSNDADERDTSFYLPFGDASPFQTQPSNYFEHGSFTYFEGGCSNQVVPTAPSPQMCPAIDSRWWASDFGPVGTESLFASASFPAQWEASNCMTDESVSPCSMPNMYPNYIITTL